MGMLHPFDAFVLAYKRGFLAVIKTDDGAERRDAAAPNAVNLHFDSFSVFAIGRADLPAMEIDRTEMRDLRNKAIGTTVSLAISPSLFAEVTTSPSPARSISGVSARLSSKAKAKSAATNVDMANMPISLQELMKWLGPMTESYVRFQIIGYFDPMTFQEIGDAMKTIELGEVFFYSMKPQLDEFLAGHLARYGVETYVGRRVTLAMSSLEVIRRHFRECTYFNKLWIDCAQPEFFNLSDFEAVFNAMMKTPVNPDYIRFEYRLRDTLFIGSFTEEVFVGLKTFRPDIAYARNASGFNRFKWKKGSNLTIEVCRYAVKSTLYFKFGKSMMSNT
ncbi:hypothetical protein L596_006378 [Steinernema carpocapsae]|uniref:Uncharacterized protein n=1 Tax=Steinernema carpocapsae TaxID=34508 RepID=A0A4U8VA07_STECR|nr:hypothetical protein L596_006378 [Steinernema carpocapsae]